MWSSLLSRFTGPLEDCCPQSCSEHVCYNSRGSIFSKMTVPVPVPALWGDSFLCYITSRVQHGSTWTALLTRSCSHASGPAGDAVREAAGTCSWRRRNLFSQNKLALGRACVSADIPQETSTQCLRAVTWKGNRQGRGRVPRWLQSSTTAPVTLPVACG